jgi:mono/diheme cytochrome c family protein
MKKDRKMKKYIMLFTLSILLLSGVSSATTIDMGKQIFDANCGFCHTGHPPTGASDAQSISALAEDAKVREASIGEIVRSGTKDGMPAFNKSDISDTDIGYLVDYLKNVPNSFDSTPTTTTNPINPIIPKNPGVTPAGTTQDGQSPATTRKAPGFEMVFVGLSVIIAYTMRRNNKL